MSINKIYVYIGYDLHLFNLPNQFLYNKIITYTFFVAALRIFVTILSLSILLSWSAKSNQKCIQNISFSKSFIYLIIPICCINVRITLLESPILNFTIVYVCRVSLSSSYMDNITLTLAWKCVILNISYNSYPFFYLPDCMYNLPLD